MMSEMEKSMKKCKINQNRIYDVSEAVRLVPVV